MSGPVRDRTAANLHATRARFGPPLRRQQQLQPPATPSGAARPPALAIVPEDPPGRGPRHRATGAAIIRTPDVTPTLTSEALGGAAAMASQEFTRPMHAAGEIPRQREHRDVVSSWWKYEESQSAASGDRDVARSSSEYQRLEAAVDNAKRALTEADEFVKIADGKVDAANVQVAAEIAAVDRLKIVLADALLRVDRQGADVDLAKSEVREAKADLDRAKSDLRDAKNDLRDAKNDRRDAKADVDRAESFLAAAEAALRDFQEAEERSFLKTAHLLWDGSTGASSRKSKPEELSVFKTCFRCGRDDTPEMRITAAHLAKTATAELVLGTKDLRRSARNYLMLCGTHGDQNSCHHELDALEGGFLLDPRTNLEDDPALRRWIPFHVTGRVGTPRLLPTAPPLRIIHAQARLVIAKMADADRASLIHAVTARAFATPGRHNIQEWLNAVTPPRAHGAAAAAPRT